MKVVGKVEDCEKKDIEKLFHKKMSLQSLFSTLPHIDISKQDELYNRIVEDMQEVEEELHKWWKEKSDKYAWESVSDGYWSIDFSTNDIILNCKPAL